MNKYVKTFLLRGMAFGGLGPIIAGIIYLILSYTLPDFTLSGQEVFCAILSTYLLAFVHAGASVFNQIETWPMAKTLFFHFFALYLAYAGCYLVNAWIPFQWQVLLIFTAIFTVLYFVVWITVVVSVKATSRRFNQQLK